MGLVFQEFELLDHLDLRDNVLLPCRLSAELTVTAEREQRARELVRDVGLGVVLAGSLAALLTSLGYVALRLLVRLS